MRALNPFIEVRPYHRRLTGEIAVDLVRGYDLVLDGTDDFDTRYLVNQACVAAGVPLSWPDEEGENNVMEMFSQHAFDLVVNIPKDHSRRELTNGYKIRRAAIDHNIPLLTNARLAGAFIKAFTSMKMEDIKIKSWQEY
jgi:hypothetical protein